ncbi:MAG: ATP-binding protein [Chloroflexi bacterium HGW-Chloroflexi-6]|nr:MAG: ATP-binding protein [Chloroflexi bacterium HGW-Chloroflexi-6]
MSQRFQITRAAELESLQVFRDFIAECCARHAIPNEIVFDLKLAVDEACTNIIQHGYRGMDPGSIILALRFEPDRILVQITDFGHVFEPDDAPMPDVTAALEEREVGGLGLFLIYQTMDNIDYQASDDGNTLTFTKLYRA